MLITGFFLYKSSSSKTPKIIRLIYDIWFYFILNIILCVVVKGSYIVALSTFFPTSLGYFWYITCYICILIFSPYLNLLIKNLEQKDHCKLLIISLIILSVIPTISGLAVGNVENGYIYSRFIWLIFLYFLGAYISKYQDIDRLLKNDREFFIKSNIFSVLITIERISEHTLGIYLLHDSPYNYLIFASFFTWFQGFSASKSLVFLIILLTVLVFIVGLIVSIIKKITADRLYQVVFDKIEQKFKASSTSFHL